jgi:hypothetical protein
VKLSYLIYLNHVQLEVTLSLLDIVTLEPITSEITPQVNAADSDCTACLDNAVILIF